MVILVSNILGAEIVKILIHVDKLLQMVTLGSVSSSKWSFTEADPATRKRESRKHGFEH